MQKSVSVKDIAQKLNISLSTVHKALTGKGGISEQRRKEVIEAAQEMGYVVNSVAQTLARKDINIGIFMPLKWQDYFAQMKAGMEKEIDNLQKYKVHGRFYYFSSDFSKEDSEKALEWIKKQSIDVLIYCPSIYSLHEEFISAIKKSNCPIFMAGDSIDEMNSISDIVTEADLSGKIAADFLRCILADKINAAVFTGSLKVKSHKGKVNSFIKRVEGFGGKVECVIETEDDNEKTVDYMKNISSDVNAIYVSTATSPPICKYIDENGLSDRIVLICTDLFDELKYYMKKNVVKATIYQNQEKLGSVAVKVAYEYWVKKNSYGNEDVQMEKTVYIRPNLCLLADVE